MDKNRSELFGHLAYDDSLTYELLLQVEEELTSRIGDLLLRAGAAHLDFTPLGDALMFQCAFERHRLYIYRRIALEMASLLPEGVQGRLLCVDKTLGPLHVYWLRKNVWQEEERPVPGEPPQGLRQWHCVSTADAYEPVTQD